MFEALVTTSSKRHTTHQQVEGQLELLEDGDEVRGSVLPQHLRQAVRAAGHGARVAQLLQQTPALLRTLGPSSGRAGVGGEEPEKWY